MAIKRPELHADFCKERMQLPIVQQAIQDPAKRRLLNEIFDCIYKSFRQPFIGSMIQRNRGIDPYKVIEMAEDAFQEGLKEFYSKTKANGLKQKASLQTIVFTYGQFQFLALRKKVFRSGSVPFDNDMYIGDLLCEEEAMWDEILETKLTEEEYRLHQAIRRLRKKKWQKILYWFYFDELNPDEIAQKLGTGKGHVNNLLTKARKELKKLLASTSLNLT